MIQLKLKNGSTVRYDKPFVLTSGPQRLPDDTFLVKIRLSSDGNAERLWAYLHPDDLQDYTNDGSGGKIRLAVLCNDSLHGFPYLALVPYVLQGIEVPHCNVALMIDRSAPLVFIGPETGLPVSPEEYEMIRNRQEA